MNPERGMTGDSCNGSERKPKVYLALGEGPRAQACPPNCPQDCPHLAEADSTESREPLGEPLSIREVAKLIGVSAWTLRHRCLKAGLPHLRMGTTGKLIFYKHQVIDWLLSEQRKGGTIL